MKKKSSPVAEAMKAKVTRKRTIRNDLEQGVEDQLRAAGLDPAYEAEAIPYTVPSRETTYLRDFRVPGTDIIIEAKGNFGGLKGQGDMKRNSAANRQKLILVREQHPELDIRIVFDRATTKIYPGSPTTNGKWATDHGFAWSDKGVVPPAWIADIIMQQKKGRKKQ